MLDRRTVFYAPPFHRALCTKFVFTGGAYRYPGSHEFMIYNKIPSCAVIRTISVQEFLDFANQEAVERVLRLNILSMKGDYRKTIRPTLHADNITLTPAVITAVARTAKAFGLGTDSTRYWSDSATEQLSQVVADLVQGLHFRIDVLSPQEWQTVAAIFAHVLCRRSVPAASFQQTENIKLGFLAGIQWSLGQFNARHSVQLIAGMQRRAKAVGLESPARILSDELDAAKLHLVSYERRQERLLSGYNSAALSLEEPATPTQARKGNSRWRAVASSSRRTARVLVYEDANEAEEEDASEIEREEDASEIESDDILYE
ncbi:hypothetical protein LTR08_003814 [Meristemomyces frigidus]|nr:hypothetical protein LTR08_003814 [Meristemomyces frigidus]